ncbi:gamma-glutamylcyclotransferase [Glycomyces sp. NPDC046736]|uniref:allophanate hydrolase-related protein n=1 Tax=Glycomyces sp. NPDC046736 TaxID=3155615 RepID=UPI0034118A1B
MFLNGGGMRGGPIHHLLGGAALIAETRTAARYRFYSVADRYPALVPVDAGGVAVAGELYDLPMRLLREDLLPSEPPELELGVVLLHDGTESLGMVLRAAYDGDADLTDISDLASWNAHLARLGER